MRRDLDGFVVMTMVVLCAIWGAQQVAIKLAAHDVVPIMQVALRSGVSAALVLAGIAVVSAQGRRRREPPMVCIRGDGRGAIGPGLAPSTEIASATCTSEGDRARSVC